jgi:FdhD protein
MYQEFDGIKFNNKSETNVGDKLTIEGVLELSINDSVFLNTMRTPGNDKQLIRGLLYSENVYTNTKENLNIKFKYEDDITMMANVLIPKHLLGEGMNTARSILSVSSCGICGKRELDIMSTFENRLKTDKKININTLYKMFEIMEDSQHTFKQSGGSHASAAFDSEGNLLSIKEDIGRHNAVDKVIGELIINQNLLNAFCIIVSGRISYEIIAKVYSAKIPVIAAVSAPSSLAVGYAKELGITLLGFCRDKRATCYTNPSRIEVEKI